MIKETPFASLNKPKEIASAPHFTHCQPASIELDGVAWSPHRNKPLLKPITVSLQPGEFLVVVGPNGSGKTSLLRCLYRINKPTQGKVLMDGKDIWSLSPRQCAQRIATVLQDTGGDFGLSVFEMVEVGLTPRSLVWGRSEEDIQIVENALALLDVGHLSQRSFDSLSGGERQRVMIARALAQQPDVLSLDEPTNHLDAESVAWLERHLQQYKGTVIAVTHDRYFLDNVAGWILELDRGFGIPWRGNYTSWLEQKQERLRRKEKSQSRRVRTLERELEWIRMATKARQSKGKARVTAYEHLLSQEVEERRENLEHRQLGASAGVPLDPGSGRLTTQRCKSRRSVRCRHTLGRDTDRVLG